MYRYSVFDQGLQVFLAIWLKASSYHKKIMMNYLKNAHGTLVENRAANSHNVGKLQCLGAHAHVFLLDMAMQTQMICHLS